MTVVVVAPGFLFIQQIYSMIICRPNLISTGYKIRLEDNQKGSLTIAPFTGQVQIHLPDGTYEVAKESFFRYRWNLTRNSEELAVANKPSPFTRKFEISSEQGNVTIQPCSLFFCRFDLRMNGEKIGSIMQTNIFTRHTTIKSPPLLPIALQVFAFALVSMAWHRARN